jgi:hypothetical protein
MMIMKKGIGGSAGADTEVLSDAAFSNFSIGLQTKIYPVHIPISANVWADEFRRHKAKATLRGPRDQNEGKNRIPTIPLSRFPFPGGGGRRTQQNSAQNFMNGLRQCTHWAREHV